MKRARLTCRAKARLVCSGTEGSQGAGQSEQGVEQEGRRADRDQITQGMADQGKAVGYFIKRPMGSHSKGMFIG